MVMDMNGYTYQNITYPAVARLERPLLVPHHYERIHCEQKVHREAPERLAELVCHARLVDLAPLVEPLGNLELGEAGLGGGSSNIILFGLAAAITEDLLEDVVLGDGGDLGEGDAERLGHGEGNEPAGEGVN